MLQGDGHSRVLSELSRVSAASLSQDPLSTTGLVWSSALLVVVSVACLALSGYFAHTLKGCWGRVSRGTRRVDAGLALTVLALGVVGLTVVGWMWGRPQAPSSSAVRAAAVQDVEASYRVSDVTPVGSDIQFRRGLWESAMEGPAAAPAVRVSLPSGGVGEYLAVLRDGHVALASVKTAAAAPSPDRLERGE